MQKKTIAMMLVAGCSIGMLTGCGVPQEEHDNMILKLKTENAQAIDELNVNMADLDSQLKTAEGKARNSLVAQDEAAERVKMIEQEKEEMTAALEAEKAALAKANQNLEATKTRAEAAEDTIEEVSAQLAAAEAEFIELERRFVQFLKNMNTLDGSVPQVVPTSTEVTPAATEVAVDEDGATPSALDILNEMSTK